MKVSLEQKVASINFSLNLFALFAYVVLFFGIGMIDFLSPYKVPILVIVASFLFLKIIPFEAKFTAPDDNGDMKTYIARGPNPIPLIATTIMIFMYPIPFTQLGMKIVEAVVLLVVYAVLYKYNKFKYRLYVDSYNKFLQESR